MIAIIWDKQKKETSWLSNYAAVHGFVVTIAVHVRHLFVPTTPVSSRGSLLAHSVLGTWHCQARRFFPWEARKRYKSDAFGALTGDCTRREEMIKKKTTAENKKSRAGCKETKGMWSRWLVDRRESWSQLIRQLIECSFNWNELFARRSALSPTLTAWQTTVDIYIVNTISRCATHCTSRKLSIAIKHNKKRL